eukprot:1156673-Pelagomonas_calceolata.AAC.6
MLRTAVPRRASPGILKGSLAGNVKVSGTEIIGNRPSLGGLWRSQTVSHIDDATALARRLRQSFSIGKLCSPARYQDRTKAVQLYLSVPKNVSYPF